MPLILAPYVSSITQALWSDRYDLENSQSIHPGLEYTVVPCKLNCVGDGNIDGEEEDHVDCGSDEDYNNCNNNDEDNNY